MVVEVRVLEERVLVVLRFEAGVVVVRMVVLVSVEFLVADGVGVGVGV